MTEHTDESVMKMLEDGFRKGAEVDEHNKKNVDAFEAGEHESGKHYEDDDESHLDVD